MLFGDCNCGKSTFALMLKGGAFTNEICSTIGVDFVNKELCTNDDRVNKIHFLIWDTAGQEKYGLITNNFFSQSNCGILFFDLSNEISFYNLEKWVSKIKLHQDLDYYKILLVGNKSDLDLKVSKDEITEFINKYNFEYIEISLKNTENVDLILNKVSEIILNDIKDYLDNNNNILDISKIFNKPKLLDIEEIPENQTLEESNKCCLIQ
jgi:small GTP-binding protein